MTEYKFFFCPSCHWLGEYWYVTEYRRDYGSIDVDGYLDLSDSDYVDSEYYCPECNASYYYEWVLVRVEINQERNEVIIETADDFDLNNYDSLIEALENELGINLRTFRIVIDDEVYREPVHTENVENREERSTEIILQPFDADESDVNRQIEKTKKVTLNDFFF